MAYDTVAAADYAEATTVYNQATDQSVPKANSQQWVMSDGTADQVMVIDTVAPARPVSWTAYDTVNTTTKVPLGFTAAQALRLKVLLNNLPS
jgi:hypothetical protein